MGIFSKLFGSDSVIDAGINAADAVFFTDEEKSEWRLRLLKAYEPFKIAQRWLAIILTTPFAALHTIGGLQILISGWMPDAFGKAIHEASLAMMEVNNDTLGLPVAVVLGFYFAGGAMEGVVKAKLGGKS